MTFNNHRIQTWNPQLFCQKCGEVLYLSNLDPLKAVCKSCNEIYLIAEQISKRSYKHNLYTSTERRLKIRVKDCVYALNRYNQKIQRGEFVLETVIQKWEKRLGEAKTALENYRFLKGGKR